MNARVNFIGGGKMGSAILAAVLLDKIWQPAAVCVAEPDEQKRQHIQKKHCVTTVANPSELPAANSYFFCTKPQDLKAACTSLCASTVLGKGTAIISIAAGITTSQLAAWLGTANVVRTMPNTPLLVNRGCTFAYSSLDKASFACKLTEQVFGACGIFSWVANEDNLNAVTALSGSGPAYAYLLIETMITAAIDMGLDEKSALSAATQTVLGACAMVSNEGKYTKSPIELRAQVTSKHGTTEAAIKVLEQEGFAAALTKAMHAAEQRSRELANENR